MATNVAIVSVACQLCNSCAPRLFFLNERFVKRFWLFLPWFYHAYNCAKHYQHYDDQNRGKEKHVILRRCGFWQCGQLARGQKCVSRKCAACCICGGFWLSLYLDFNLV